MTDIKLYARWVNCIGEHCPNGKMGICRKYGTDFPWDKKCYYPELLEYEEELAEYGPYETWG